MASSDYYKYQHDSEHLQALTLLVQPVMSIAYVEFPIHTVHC